MQARYAWLLVLAFGLSSSAFAQTGKTAVRGTDDAAAFLRAHCFKCHGEKKKSGGVRLDDLPADLSKDVDRWLAVRDQVRDGLMPPAREPRPHADASRTLVAWISSQAQVKAARLPNQGNLIPHELLFGKAETSDQASPGRVWRLSPEGYLAWIREFRNVKSGIVQPFTLVPDRGIKDFAGLYTIDEPSTEILLRNAELIVEGLTAHEVKDGKVHGKNGAPREFVSLMDPKAVPSHKDLESAIQAIHRMALSRSASSDEVARLLAFYERCAKDVDRPGALKTMLQAVLLKTDAMYRSELGRGKTDEKGRSRLGNLELALALSYAIGDRRDASFVLAAEKGDLATREQIAAAVRRRLDDPKFDTSRMLRFFREYFDYAKAVDIFKEKPKTFIHDPRLLVSDTDRLILHLVKADRDVLRELLTTNLTFANFSLNTNKQGEGPKPAVVPNPINNKGQAAPHFVYGFDSWPSPQPAALPKDQRLGILMQPSWLVAHGTNFETDPVRRGRWIRERLLGGVVPDLPIGVAAQVPDDKHRTFRDRLTVTRAEQCWKCHRHMDELGLAFEQFDHYGVFRTAELVEDPEATAKNVDKKGKSLGPVLKALPLDTTGNITGSGDAKLDGDVAEPRVLVRRLAESERVRQVFVRHAFRFFMGRNESLSDAVALQEADQAYVASGGSFKTLVVSLLTSDPFLYRRGPALAESQEKNR